MTLDLERETDGVVVTSFIPTGDRRKWDWDLCAGFECARILTYSSSIFTIRRFFEQLDYQDVELVIGSERVARAFEELVHIQAAIGATLEELYKSLPGESQTLLAQKIRANALRIFVMHAYTNHTKSFLLEGETRRHLFGSANLSERAFSHYQFEDIGMVDERVMEECEEASRFEEYWSAQLERYIEIRNTATQELDLLQFVDGEALSLASLPLTKIQKAEVVTLRDYETDESVDGMNEPVPSMLLDMAEERQKRIAPQLRSTLTRTEARSSKVSNTLRQKLAGLTRPLLRALQPQDVPQAMTLDRSARKLVLDGVAMEIQYADNDVAADVKSFREYMDRMEQDFRGDTSRLAKNYWVLLVWLYSTPFLPDMRRRAYIQRQDLIRFPQYCIVHGKASCGKSEFIETALWSMFGDKGYRMLSQDKFTPTEIAQIRLRHGLMPAVFDDVAEKRFRSHADAVIKDETEPPSEDHACVIVSMNEASFQSFKPELTKRALFINPPASMPVWLESRSRENRFWLRSVRERMTQGLFKCFVNRMLDVTESDPAPVDWLRTSSVELKKIFEDYGLVDLPHWVEEVDSASFHEDKFVELKQKIEELLRPQQFSKTEREVGESGWTIDGEQIVVLERTDSWNRTPFPWAAFPSALIDEGRSMGNKKVLHRQALAEFMGRSIDSPLQKKLTRKIGDLLRPRQ